MEKVRKNARRPAVLYGCIVGRLGVSTAPERSICDEVCWVPEADRGKALALAVAWAWSLLLAAATSSVTRSGRVYRESGRGPGVEAAVEIGGLG